MRKAPTAGLVNRIAWFRAAKNRLGSLVRRQEQSLTSKSNDELPSRQGRRAPGARRLLADAIKVARRAEEDFAVGERRGAQGIGAIERVLRDEFVGGPSLDTGRLRRFARHINFAIGQNR